MLQAWSLAGGMGENSWLLRGEIMWYKSYEIRLNSLKDLKRFSLREKARKITPE